MNDKPHPLSKRNLLSFVGANLTLGVLLSWAANIIQILSVKNGLIIIATLLGVSGVVLAIQIYNYQYTTIENYKQQLVAEKARSTDLQNRLDRLVIEFRSRSAVNPRPIVVNAVVCTKRLERVPLAFQVIDITPKLIVIDKGEIHGITYGMAFAIYTLNTNQHLEVCIVDHVDNSVCWLSHSGTNISAQMNKNDISIRLVYPPDVQDAEREIAEILLIAEGAVSM
jgi:hypothetical protein